MLRSTACGGASGGAKVAATGAGLGCANACGACASVAAASADCRKPRRVSCDPCCASPSNAEGAAACASCSAPGSIATVWCDPCDSPCIAHSPSIIGSTDYPQGHRALCTRSHISQQFNPAAARPATPARPSAPRSSPSPGKCNNRLYQSGRSEEHTSELQSHSDLVCRL